MALPLALGIAAAFAAAGGVGSGVHGVVKMKGANSVAKSAGERHNKNIARFEICNSRTAGTMDKLGSQELDILASFSQFSEIFEKIQNKPDFKEFLCKSVELPHYDKEEISKVSIGAGVLVGGLGGAALGTAGGFAAAGATTAAVMALGTASTGTAIASLSGAAATNATLAALGGGAIAAGGGGIALGTTMLGVTTAGIGLLVGGIVFSIAGSTISHKAEKTYEEMLNAEKKINKVCAYLNELNQVANRYIKTLDSVNYIYRRHLNALDAIVNINKKTDWQDFTANERLVTANTVLLVQLLYKMCQVKVVLASNEEERFNKVNKNDVSNNISMAQSLIRERGFEEKKAKQQEKELHNEQESYCLAMTALLYYFAKCDGSISIDESQIIVSAIQPWIENWSDSDKLLSEIEAIKLISPFEFENLCEYLDKIDVSSLDEFGALVEHVISASDGISNVEKEAKKKFEEYLKSRKNN